ncbi:hypothetical protein BVRB_1g022520 [Beta vulgaris subsp. vulgaris]|nr:hypothetical protein BVRB_1g022520 [Beta vulgaris subsp. vulgaris]
MRLKITSLSFFSEGCIVFKHICLVMDGSAGASSSSPSVSSSSSISTSRVIISC